MGWYTLEKKPDNCRLRQKIGTSGCTIYKITKNGSLVILCLCGLILGEKKLLWNHFFRTPIKDVQKGRVRPWYCVLQSVQKSTSKYPGSTVRSKVPRRPQPFPPQNLHCLLLPGYLDGGTLWLFIFIRAYSFIHRVPAWKDAVSRCPAHAHQIFAALPPPKT